MSLARATSDEARPRVRPRGGALGQLVIVVAAWGAYTLARSHASDNVAAAVAHGQRVLSWDQALGFGWLLGVNHWATQHEAVAVPLSMVYASLHYLVTASVLVWLWWRRPEAYRPALVAMITMCVVGLLVFVAVPVAPPRLLPGAGWDDTLLAWSNVGWWGDAASAPQGLGEITNQYAAMPSLHVGWAVWCAWVLWQVGPPLLRRWGWLYPTLVGVTVIVTGNHYLLDVVAGLVIALVSCFGISRLLGSPGDLLVHDAEPAREPEPGQLSST